MGSTALFKHALERHLENLSPEERRAFSHVTAHQVVEMARNVDSTHRDKSRSRKYGDKFQTIVQRLDGFFKTLDAVASLSPEIVSVIWGGLKVIIKMASSFVNYFRKLTDILDQIAEKLVIYDDYARYLYKDRNQVHNALTEVYGHILSLCTIAYRTFRSRDGKDRWTIQVALIAMNPFSRRLDRVMAQFIASHARVEREVTHADRLKAKEEFRSAEEARHEAARARKAEQVDRAERERERLEAEAARRRAEAEQKKVEAERQARSVEKRRAKMIEQTTGFMDKLHIFDCTDVHAQFFKAPLSDSGRWLLEADQFRAWMSLDNDAPGTLWYHAKAGAGKSTLASITIENIKYTHGDNEGVALAYFYCSFRESGRRRSSTVAQTILHQILRRLPPVSPYLAPLIEEFSGGKPMDIHNTADLVVRLTSHLRRTYVVIDGLDELERDELSRTLLFLNIIRRRSRVRLLVFSRDIPDVRRVFEHEPQLCPVPAQVDWDIRRFVSSELSRRREAGQLVVRDPRLVACIEDALTEAADGMFLWPALQIEQICGAQTDDDIGDSLKRLPKGLDATYHRSLERINMLPPRRAQRSQRALKWVVGALEPLTLLQLAEAVAIDDMQGNRWDSSRVVNDTRTLVDDCANLCIIVPGHESGHESTVQLVHASLVDFLCSTGDVPKDSLSQRLVPTLGKLHLELFSACMKYARLTENSGPLKRYTASPLGHLRAAEDADGTLVGELMECFNSYSAERHPLVVGFRLLDAILADLPSVTLALIQDTTLGPNALIGFPGTSALHIAIQFRSHRAIELLLRHGADVSLRDDNGATPFHRAVEMGASEAMLMIVHAYRDKGGDLELRDHGGRNALFYAQNQPASIQALVDCGADVNSLCDGTHTALQLAAADGNAEIARVLADLGSDVNWLDCVGRAPLHLALMFTEWRGPAPSPEARVARAVTQTVSALLAAGAHADVADTHGCRPIHLAVDRGLAGAAHALLARGARWDTFDVHRTGELPCLPAAHFVTARAHTHLRGVDVELMSLLSGATASAERTSPPPVLVKLGAPRAEWTGAGAHMGYQRHSVMELYARWQWDILLEMLLHSHDHDEPASPVAMSPGGSGGAGWEFLVGVPDPDAVDCDGSTLLHIAARHGLQHAVAQLIGQGVDVHACDARGHGALHYAQLAQTSVRDDEVRAKSYRLIVEQLRAVGAREDEAAFRREFSSMINGDEEDDSEEEEHEAHAGSPISIGNIRETMRLTQGQLLAVPGLQFVMPNPVIFPTSLVGRTS